MKWLTFFAVLLLRHLAVAAPTEAEDVIAAAEVGIDVTVWVDEKGQTLSAETVQQLQLLPTSVPARTISSRTSLTPNTIQEPTALPPILAVPGLEAPHDLAPNLAADVNIQTNTNPNPYDEDGERPQEDRHTFRISYSPYNSDNSCKSPEQVDDDLNKLTKYDFIRIYGVDCDQTRKVINVARPHNMRVFAGVYDLQNLHANLKTIVDSAGPDLSTLHTISIGNELVNRNQSSAADVANAVNDARVYLRGLDYTGPVVTVDTFSKVLENPTLCQVSDYCAANCHAFFDANQTPETAGLYVADIARQLSEISGGKRTLITESGWPHAGQSNGRAVPSPENQRKALENLRSTFREKKQDLVLFSAFDDLWKVDSQWTFRAERVWGIEV